jgi:hypothetical protein
LDLKPSRTYTSLLRRVLIPSDSRELFSSSPLLSPRLSPKRRITASRFPSQRARLTRPLRLPEASQVKAAERVAVVVTAEKVAVEVTEEAVIVVVAVAATADPELRARAVSADPELKVRPVSADPDKRVIADLEEKMAVRADPEPKAAIKVREEEEAEVVNSVVTEAVEKVLNSSLLRVVEEKSEHVVVMANTEAASEEVSVVVAEASEVIEDLLRVDTPDKEAIALETTTAITLEAEAVREEQVQAVPAVPLVAASPLSESDKIQVCSSNFC